MQFFTFTSPIKRGPASLWQAKWSLLLGLLLSIGSAWAQPTILGTNVATVTNAAYGTYVTYDLADRGRYRQVRIQAGNSTSNNVAEWQFAQGSNATGIDYSSKWLPYNYNSIRYQLASFNQVIAPNTAYPPTTGTATFAGNTGQPGGLPALTAGYYYTFNITKVAPSGDNTMAVLETAYAPVAITAISPTAPTTAYGNPVTVTATLGGIPSTGEYVYLRYSTDNYATSTLVPMTVSGTTATATIPNLGSSAANASYYALSSFSNSLTNANADLLTLNASPVGGPITYTQTTFVSVTQNPAANAVPYGSPVTVTANYSGTLGAGEYLYLRYSADGYATSTTVAPTTQNGATATFTIPNQTSVSNTNPTVSYYLVTSTDPNAAGSGTPSYLQIDNNGGNNYRYTYTTSALSSTAQSPTNGSVPYGSPVTVTLNLGSTPGANEYFYLIYSVDNFSSKTALAATSQSGTTVTFTIPNLTTTSRPTPTVQYYLLSSPASTAAAETSAGFPYINLLNNNGANYNYAYTTTPITSTARTPSGTVYAATPVAINSALGRTPDATEYFYVRYTTDNYATSTIAALTVAGNTATGTLPGQPSGTNVSYYIFSNPSNALAGNYTGNAGAFAIINIDNNGGANYSYTVVAPLPVSLTRFEATRQDQNVALTWATASETDNAGFEIQVSLDGKDFRKLAFVTPASPGSLTVRTYSFVDREAGKVGTRYYRLRQVDLDGQASFSAVRLVSFEASAVLTAAPNPFSEQLALSVWAGAATTTPLTLTDALGRVVLHQMVTLGAGANQLELPGLAALPAGMYLLQLPLNGQPHTMKLLKQ